ncbi:MAG: substrate-binding domain-containing protein [Gammaproteobacteria bacterium]|nr:substrate-binding domain-containing protein [Gammaproteobacteria bacterium]
MKPLHLLLLALSCVVGDLLAAAGTAPRTHVLIVGSSTAYPIIATVAERFGRDPDHATPVVESTGTGGGFKLFCGGSGPSTPDLVMASRPMKDSERRQCTDNDVVDIREIKIGYDGVVIVNRRGAPAFSLSNRDIWLAMAQQVPRTPDGDELVTNFHERWSDVNPDLPDVPIRILGPPPTSGTRDILLERLLRKACDTFPALHELIETDPQAFAQRCYTLREDGAFVNAGENDGRLVRKLLNDPDAVGILGFNFLDRNYDRLQAASIDGIEPRFELIESGIYPLSRPLYLYAKPRHARVVPELDLFVEELVASHASGREGYLVDHGLIPLR